MKGLPAIAYLGIGSNVGDRLAFCQQAVRAISAPDIIVRKVSSLYETEPVEYLQQGWFYNAVVRVETPRTPGALLKHCQEIEQCLGKHITIPKGPRTIDLDILFYQDRIIQGPNLTVPHPSALKRAFVLIPMAEIAPDFIPPTCNETIQGILEAMPAGPAIKKVFGPNWVTQRMKEKDR